MSATSAVVTIDDTALTAILPFIAFVQRHLASIAPSIVVILFNHLTADQANHLASALLSNNSIKLQLFRCDVDDEQPTIYPATLVHESALWIVLEPYDSANSRFAFKAPLRTIDLVLPCPVGGDPLFLGYFTGKITLLTVDTHVIERNLAFRVWHVTKCCLQQSSGLVSERTLVKSLFWQKFMQQVNVLPNGELITAVGDAPTNVLGVAMVQLLRHRQSVYMFGYRVGLLKLLAERLNGGFLNYKSVMSLKERAQVVYPEPLNVSTIDERLALSFQINDTQMSTYKLALKPHLRYKMFKTVNYASHTRFVVLVPRVVVRSQSNTWSEIYPKIIIIVCIVLSAILFAVLRFGFRCLMNGFDGASTVSSVMDSIFDTLPRSMANTTGSSQIGRSTAERQLLIVIGFFGFLAGCMMSGNLYEGLLNVSEIQFRYRNLSDVCRDRLDLLMHPDLAPTQQSQSINQSLRTTSSNSLLFVDDCLQTVKILRDPQILPNSALVLSEEQLVQLNHSQHMFMQLPQVYVTIPEYVFTNQHFMVPVVQRTMQHIVDHGLLAELQSIAQHANAIRIATNNHHQHHHHSHKSEDPRSLADSMFEFYVLGFGLGLAVIVFFGEQIIGRKQRTVFFGMGNGPQNQQIYGFGKRKKLVGRIGHRQSQGCDRIV